MLMRSLFAAAIVLATSAAVEAASVTHFVLKCVDRQEVSSDDIYLAATVDGKPVAWGKDHQNGTSNDKSINMNDGDVLTLDSASLGLLKFDKTAQIVIKEKDVTADEVIGTVSLTPTDGMKKAVFKSGDFEYHVEYKVE